MKKILYGLMTGLLAISVLAACGDVEGEPEMNDPAGDSVDEGVME
ncbi:hypothetical protein [Bacillus sp. JCM 19034]|nr:hypothetical protein [Bacillus sp. JCM 19034]